MKKILLLLFLCHTFAVFAQKDDMRTHTMVFLKGDNKYRENSKHQKYIQKLRKSGVNLMSGKLTGHPEWKEIIIIDTDSIEKAKTIMNADPGLKKGTYSYEFLPWLTARNYIFKPEEPAMTKTFFIGFLQKSKTWTPEVTEETKKIGEGHMAHIGKMAADGHLALAGPFMNNGFFRGVFIFKTADLETAKNVSSQDPVIRSGRMEINIYKWEIPAGILK
jgi:uncharacterized protein YciI